MATFRTSLAVTGSTALMVAMPTWCAAPASAATPANHACFGVDLSGYARAESPHGQVVSDLARNVRLEALVQQHQAGELSDDAFPNTCND